MGQFTSIIVLPFVVLVIGNVAIIAGNDININNTKLAKPTAAHDVVFNMTATGPLFIFLWKPTTLYINYTVTCPSKNQTYLVHVGSSNDDIVMVRRATMVVYCDDPGLTEGIRSQNDNSQSGLLPVSVYADTIGLVMLQFSSYLVESNSYSTYAIPDSTNKINQRHEIGQAVSQRQEVSQHEEVNRRQEVNQRQDFSHRQIISHQAIPVIVLKEFTVWDDIYRLVISVCLIVITMGFGAKLDPAVIKEALKKPIALTIGFCCQYILMPLIAYTIAKTFPIDRPTVAFGLFVCGVCPGGGASNMHTLLFDGDVSLSVTMTFISTITAIGMMPLWVYTLGKTFFTEDFKPVIPYTAMLQVMAMLIIPLLIGAIIKLKAPRAADRFLKFLKPFTIVFMIVGLGTALYVNWFSFRMFKPMYVLAGCLLPYIGYTLGGLAAIICRQPKERVIAIAIETGMQNAGVGLLLVLFSFPPPDGDIAAISPVVSGLMTPLLPFFLFLALTLYRKCFKKYTMVTTDEEQTKQHNCTKDHHHVTGDRCKEKLELKEGKV